MVGQTNSGDMPVDISSMLVVDTVATTQFTVAASGYGGTSVDVTKAGYTFLGIMTYRISNGTGGANESSCWIYREFVDESEPGITKINFALGNRATSKATVYVEARCLYMKNR